MLGGLLAKASHDLADPHAALSQSRTAWLCAEQADHDGLRAWISGLQSLICHWARRPHDSISYAQRGALYAERASSTAMVSLPASEARAWAALGNAERAHDAIERAERAWEQVHRTRSIRWEVLAHHTEPARGDRRRCRCPRPGARSEQRINGIVHSVNRVHRALSHVPTSATTRELQEQIENYTQTPMRMLAK